MRYLFCPIASHGFVYPAVGIAEALRRRGHEAAFATGRQFAGTIAEAGFERVPRGANDGDSFDVTNWAHPLSAAIQVKHVEHALRRFAPDVIVTSQLANGPLLAAEREGVPVAVLGLAAYLWPLLPAGVGPRTEEEKLLDWRHGDMMVHHNRARAVFGMPVVEAHPLESPLQGDLFMVQSVPELETRAGEFPGHVRCVGSCLWEPPLGADGELAGWLEASAAGGRQVVYVQHGPSFYKPGFWSRLVAALRDRPVRVVASVGRMDKERGEVPADWLVRAHVPQGQVLPFAGAVVTTGHTSAVLGALSHGLPSLLFPAGSGTEDIAGRCVGAGAALAVFENDPGPPPLKTLLDRLLHDESLRAGARRLREALARYDGCEAAAGLIAGLRGRAASTLTSAAA